MKNREVYYYDVKRKDEDSSFFFTTTDGIGRYLNTVLTYWGYKVEFNNSNQSDSCYITSDIGFIEMYNPLKIRVSNHSIQKNETVVDYDVYAGFLRTSAISYVDLIYDLAFQLDQKVPRRIMALRPGSIYYRQYKIELQRRAAIVRTKGYWPKSQRFYV